MLLLDAIFINNGGGKVLLDYLILSLEKSNIDLVYLLDERVLNNHPSISNNEVFYLKGNLYSRHQFYKKYGKRFTKVFCFGNLPPTIHIEAEVIVYFHQPLFLNLPSDISFYQKVMFKIKSRILGKLVGNAQIWLVQSGQVKTGLIKRFPRILEKKVTIAPFYPPLRPPLNILRKDHSFLYVSGGSPHKNHINLLAAFKIYFDRNGLGELHLTVGEEFKLINEMIREMVKDGYPITNHGNIPRDKVGELYYAAKFQIFPSYAESFGLGLIEAMDCGCIIIGSDLPFLHAVCETPFVFNPYNVNSIVDVMESANESNNSVSKCLVQDKISEIINLLNQFINEK